MVPRKIDSQTTITYLIAQVTGAMVAGVVLWFVISPANDLQGSYGATRLAPNVDLFQGLVIELILTFFLVSTVSQAAAYENKPDQGAITPLLIGFTLAAAILAGGALTGASLNPARTLGPELANILGGGTSALTDPTLFINLIGVYMIGIFAGGILAGLLHSKVFSPDN